MDIRHCDVCPRHCGIDRNTAAGFCKTGASARVARAALHAWEEPCISGTNGSGTVFFTGCSLRCVFCQNDVISTGKIQGTAVTPRQLHDLFCRLIDQGAHNINLVNPTHFAPAILEALQIEKLPVPVVYNSSGYESVETLKQLEGWIGIYLPDFKYADNKLAMRYSHAPDYYEVTAAAIAEMIRQTGPCVFDDNGLLKRGTIIRHLILPSHVRNSIAVLRAIDRLFGKSAYVSLMAQYIPAGRAADFPEINRTLTQEEFDRVSAVLENLNLPGYMQELSSADQAYVPPFENDLKL